MSAQAASAQVGTSASKPTHCRRTSSLLPSLNSLGSFLASAGGLTSSEVSSAVTTSAGGGLSTDAELMISDPTPTEWADEASPVKGTRSSARVAPRNLSQEVRFRGQPQRVLANNSMGQSFIAFPAPGSPTMSDARPKALSRTSSAASTARESDIEPMGSAGSDTPVSSLKSPESMVKEVGVLTSPPSESTVKGARVDAASSRQYDHQTLPRSFAPASLAESRAQGASHGRTASLSAASGRNATRNLDEALSSNESTVQRQAGFRARSINSIRGLAAAWVPARLIPASQPSSSASSASSDDVSDSNSPRWRDGLALTTVSDGKGVVRHGAGDVKRPVKLDRRRLDKAVSLAVEAAQAAEEDERLWEEKRAKKASSRNSTARPALQAAWSSSSRNSVEDQRQLARRDSATDADASLASEEDEDEDDLGFSLDLYISSLGYLISALSDKEAPGLSNKQRQDIRQRLEEGMSKLGFDAKAELEKAESMKRELELEREKLQLQQAAASPAAANVIHHHYHTAVPTNSSIFGDGANFSRAHAAAKASSRGSSSLAGKISSSVLDVGLHIGAGALSALSANLSAIAPRGGDGGSGGGGGRKTETAKEMDDPRITDLDNDEDLQSVDQATDSRRGSPSQPASGAATPRTAWTRAISQNNKQWELAVAFASTAASALASSLRAVARSDDPPPTTTAITSTPVNGPLTPAQQQHLAQWGHLEPAPDPTSAEDCLILLSASLARALKRSPLPTQLYQLLRQLVSLLAAIDARYSITEKGTQMAVRETSRAMRFVRRHDLHVKAVRVAWAAAEAAVAALEAMRPVYGVETVGVEARLAIADWSMLESQLDDAERILEAAAREGGGKGGKQRLKVERSTT